MTPSPAPRAPLALIFTLFAAGYFLSYCFRSAGPLIAPDLMRELQLDAGQLGLLASAYFLTFAIAQPFIGIAMDRHGPARINAVLFVIAATGAAVFAVGESIAALALGRALIGLGVSGALMTALKALVVWYPLRQREALSSVMMAVGGMAAMIVSVPAEMAMRSIGWRGLFWLMAAASVIVAAALWWRLSARYLPASGSQSHSPDGDVKLHALPALIAPAQTAAPAPATATGSAPVTKANTAPNATTDDAARRAIAGGYRTIFGSRIFAAYAPIAFFSSGGFSAVQSLWAGPWLINAAGHSRASAAGVLFVYGLALFAGYLMTAFITARLQRVPGAPRRFYMASLSLAYAALGAIVANVWPSSSLPWFALGLTVGGGMLAYPALTRAFPAAIAGRVVTAYNMVMFVGAFLLQWGIGALIQAQLDRGASTLAAYQISLGALLLTQILALAWFWLLSRTPRIPAHQPGRPE